MHIGTCLYIYIWHTLQRVGTSREAYTASTFVSVFFFCFGDNGRDDNKLSVEVRYMQHTHTYVCIIFYARVQFAYNIMMVVDIGIHKNMPCDVGIMLYYIEYDILYLPLLLSQCRHSRRGVLPIVKNRGDDVSRANNIAPGWPWAFPVLP